MKRCIFVLIFVVCGCVQKPKQVPLPPLPESFLHGTKFVSYVERARKDPPRLDFPPTVIKIEWQNPESAFASNYQTVVEQSVDFWAWRELARFPYATSGTLEVTNTLPAVYYRIANTLKP